MRRTRPVEERFWEKAQKTDSCWIWVGAKNDHGYGQIWVISKLIYAHRWSYESFVGQIPTGMFIDHLCRTPACVRPDHLEPVYHRENFLRGIKDTAIIYLTKVCKYGHDMKKVGAIQFPCGKTKCFTCYEDYLRRRRLERALRGANLREATGALSRTTNPKTVVTYYS